MEIKKHLHFLQAKSRKLSFAFKPLYSDSLKKIQYNQLLLELLNIVQLFLPCNIQFYRNVLYMHQLLFGFSQKQMKQWFPLHRCGNLDRFTQFILVPLYFSLKAKKYPNTIFFLDKISLMHFLTIFFHTNNIWLASSLVTCSRWREVTLTAPVFEGLEHNMCGDTLKPLKMLWINLFPFALYTHCLMLSDFKWDGYKRWKLLLCLIL